MKRITLVASLLLLICSNIINAQTTNKTGYYLVGSGLFTMTAGIVIHDCMEQSAINKLKDNNKGVTSVAVMTENQKSYNKTMQNARAVSVTCGLMGLVVAVAGICDLVADDGSVTVASSNDGSKKLGLTSTGTQVGLCFKF